MVACKLYKSITDASLWSNFKNEIRNPMEQFETQFEGRKIFIYLKLDFNRRRRYK